MSYLALHAAGPDITGVLSILPIAFSPVLPGVAEVTAQHQLVIFLRFVFTKKWILQRLGAIFLLEHQPEGVFWIFLCQPAMTAMKPETAGGAEVRAIDH